MVITSSDEPKGYRILYISHPNTLIGNVFGQKYDRLSIYHGQHSSHAHRQRLQETPYIFSLYFPFTTHANFRLKTDGLPATKKAEKQMQFWCNRHQKNSNKHAIAAIGHLGQELWALNQH
ncbi:uncharacterized protein Dyak_GE28054 [Drosophila yakuba]|uniref:Uncharacterized protein n=1 Tax=Drosophila yakuba TaxID=7245 RepID=A0A0R1E6L5_DROYA|nr:uncharacterized protein Dyak_GE28054 [Drosophila yakuba]